MPSVLLTFQAEEDLLEVGSFIAADNPEAADRLLDGIGKTCRMLAANPEAGRIREELSPGLRSVPRGNYVIFYRPSADGVVVVRVLHGARDLPGLFEGPS
jgi:toxin ParE1/3/4